MAYNLSKVASSEAALCGGYRSSFGNIKNV